MWFLGVVSGVIGVAIMIIAARFAISSLIIVSGIFWFLGLALGWPEPPFVTWAFDRASNALAIKRKGFFTVAKSYTLSDIREALVDFRHEIVREQFTETCYIVLSMRNEYLTITEANDIYTCQEKEDTVDTINKWLVSSTDQHALEDERGFAFRLPGAQPRWKRINPISTYNKRNACG